MRTMLRLAQLIYCVLLQATAMHVGSHNVHKDKICKIHKMFMLVHM